MPQRESSPRRSRRGAPGLVSQALKRLRRRSFRHADTRALEAGRDGKAAENRFKLPRFASPLMRRIFLLNTLPLAILAVTLLFLNDFQNSLLETDVNACASRLISMLLPWGRLLLCAIRHGILFQGRSFSSMAIRRDRFCCV